MLDERTFGEQAKEWRIWQESYLMAQAPVLSVKNTEIFWESTQTQ